ncbi:glycosyltransferase [Adlercreutzia sp. ZJ141]|uniref:glycosyltransferase n=1 Tax=Adlercreutzia sp. ZJ141 TaxID=2709406 RepID=UPI0013EDFB58|nr:glycosyltransferase [Adlercreutzia sp. ZJ141]
MNSEKIYFVINQLGGVGCGGSDRVLSILANEFSENGFDVEILCLHDNAKIDRPLNDSIKVTFLDPIKWGRKSLRNISRIAQSIRLVSRVARGSSEATFISFIDWVNFCTVVGCRNTHNTVIVSERTDPSKEPGNRLAKCLRDKAYAKSDGIVFQTPDARDYFKDSIRSKSTIICNPITANLPSWGFNRGSKEVVALCRLEQQKNIPLLLEAFGLFHEHHSDYRLAIYGQGSLEAELAQLIEDMRLSHSVSLMGFTKDAHEAMVNCSMFVNSSDYEGMSNSLLEALAMGVPVVSTDCPVGAARMLIRDGENGILVPVGSPEDLSAAMATIADDASLACQMSERAKTIYRRLSPESIYRQWVQYVTWVKS